MKQPDDHLWVLVLAAGEGKRLSSVTRDASGRHVPKQYCSFFGGGSLLEHTLDRAAGLATPERVVTVVAEDHRVWWEPLLDEIPSDNLVVQTHDQGTGAGVLLPLAVIANRDPDATIVVMPSDHFVEEEAVMESALRRSVDLARAEPEPVVLLGVTPERPETGYGWIVPRHLDDGAAPRVAHFVEKPGWERARTLMEQGALWSSFLLTARARALVDLFQHAAPTMLKELLGGLIMEQDGPGAPTVYHNDHVPRMDFSGDILEASPERLRVIPVPPCGWTDLGTPERLRACLSELGRDPRADYRLRHGDRSRVSFH